MNWMDFFASGGGVVKDLVYARKPQTLEKFGGFVEDVCIDVDDSRQLCGPVCAGVPERRIVSW
jgi:hypothetical protein